MTLTSAAVLKKLHANKMRLRNALNNLLRVRIVQLSLDVLKLLEVFLHGRCKPQAYAMAGSRDAGTC